MRHLDVPPVDVVNGTIPCQPSICGSRFPPELIVVDFIGPIHYRNEVVGESTRSIVAARCNALRCRLTCGGRTVKPRRSIALRRRCVRKNSIVHIPCKRHLEDRVTNRDRLEIAQVVDVVSTTNVQMISVVHTKLFCKMGYRSRSVAKCRESFKPSLKLVRPKTERRFDAVIQMGGKFSEHGNFILGSRDVVDELNARRFDIEAVRRVT